MCLVCTDADNSLHFVCSVPVVSVSLSPMAGVLATAYYQVRKSSAEATVHDDCCCGICVIQ